MRELNTMPQWAGSCWYYLRFIDPQNDEAGWDPDKERYWMPVDLYVGGAEHAVLHLLYARFWHKVLYDLGHVSSPEPFGRLFNQGYILADAFQDSRGMYVPAVEVEERDAKHKRYWALIADLARSGLFDVVGHLGLVVVPLLGEGAHPHGPGQQVGPGQGHLDRLVGKLIDDRSDVSDSIARIE